MKPVLGEILLFKIDPGDFGRWRPLLTTFVHDDGRVDGEVFFAWDKDVNAEWPQKNLFYRLDKQQRTASVLGVRPGDAVGEYKFREPGLLERLKMLEERIQGMGKLTPTGPPPVMSPVKGKK